MISFCMQSLTLLKVESGLGFFMSVVALLIVFPTQLESAQLDVCSSIYGLFTELHQTNDGILISDFVVDFWKPKSPLFGMNKPYIEILGYLLQTSRRPFFDFTSLNLSKMQLKL